MDTNSMASRFKAARNRSGLTVQAAANEIGCSRPLVLSWESGATKSIGGQYLLAAAEVYQVDPRWLLGQAEDDGYPWSPDRPSRTVSAVAAIETRAGQYRVEQIDGRADMGEGSENEDYPEVVRAMDFSDSYIRNLIGFLPPPGRLKLVTGVGDSMVPRIQPGEVVLVDTGCSEYQGDGIYLINSGNGQQLKALQDRGDAVYVVSANSSLYPPFPAPKGTLVAGKAYLIGKLERVA
ncbi:XRE family transcriptional regulator [Stenotrophomonas maltophilia]|uniref:XRE family transcriptional regulator n=1 Tax=Stenotrophomonas maltophilia TaxID=40324 RepID=UPI0039C0E69F